MRENNSDHAAQPKKAGEVSAKPSKKAGIFARLSNGSRRHEHEFLPAALEILETPPSPVGRTTALLLCALFVIALTWSIVGQIEINATAQAQIVPIGGVKTLQSLETAVVRRILVDDGQFVKKGDLLVELDSTESMTDLSQLQNQLDRARKDATRYAAFLSALGVELEEYNSGTENNNDEINHPEKLPRGLKHNAIFIDSGKQPHADIEQSKNISLDQKRLLVAELIAYQSKSAALEAQISESDAIIRSSSHEYQKHRDRLKLLETKADALKKMVERHGTAKLQWLEAEQERSATRDSMSIEREHALQTKASRARVQSELKQYQADIQRDVLAKWIEARDTTLKNELDIARYRERERHRYLRAPADGTIQELKIRTVGGVVQPAQPLLTIVPESAKLAVDAKILNQDVGFVRPGQPVRLKIDSFPYTKYGVLNGSVVYLSPDATPDEKLGLVYTARIQFEQDAITAKSNQLPIQAGMAVVAEIKTDSRRVIDYLLSPIKEMVSDGLKER